MTAADEATKATGNGASADAARKLTQSILGEVWDVLEGFRPPVPSFCDYIAFRIEEQFAGADPARIIASCGPVKSDLDAQGRWKDSTRKTLEMRDVNGKRYRVTVEDMAEIAA